MYRSGSSEFCIFPNGIAASCRRLADISFLNFASLQHVAFDLQTIGFSSMTDKDKPASAAKESPADDVIVRERWLSTWNPSNDPEKISCSHAFDIMLFCFCECATRCLCSAAVLTSPRAFSSHQAVPRRLSRGQNGHLPPPNE